MWANGKDDKPSSTIARWVYFICIGIFFWAIDMSAIWQGIVAAFGMHLLFFDYSLNLVRGKAFFYHGVNDYWINIKLWSKRIALPADAIPWYGELFGKLVIAYSCWIAFFHLSWITIGDYPKDLIDYFMF